VYICNNVTGWRKGVIFVNGFNIGRYWDVGPQKTLYVPAPLLRPGPNQLLMFELHMSSWLTGGHVTLESLPDLGPPVLHDLMLPWSARLQIYALRMIVSLGDWVWTLIRLFL